MMQTQLPALNGRVRPIEGYNHPQCNGFLIGIMNTQCYIQIQDFQDEKVGLPKRNWPEHFTNASAICYVHFDEEVKAHPESDSMFRTLGVPVEYLEVVND